MNVKNAEQNHARPTPPDAMFAFALVDQLPVHDQLAFAITILSMLAEDNADNSDLIAAGYVHTGCKVTNAINFLNKLTSDHTKTCPFAQGTAERVEVEA